MSAAAPAPLELDTAFDPAYGRAVEVAPGVARLTVENPSPFTFHGTNSYIVGTDELAIIDPGPEDEAHLARLIEAIDGRPVTHILVSHSHRDHSPLADRLKALTGAKTVAEGVYRPSRPLRLGEVNPLDAAADTDFVPDIALGDGEAVEGKGWRLSAILTPGHCANHACFALDGPDGPTGIVFSADHVMAWSTSIVAPPDGAMSDFMSSLDTMMARREDRLYLPGHGGPVTRPARFLRGLKAHRLMRERAILERVSAGDRTIADIVAVMYRTTDPRLHGAAALSVLAHLEDLVARGLVRAEGEVALDGVFAPG